jgi:hypothetical protein
VAFRAKYGIISPIRSPTEREFTGMNQVLKGIWKIQPDQADIIITCTNGDEDGSQWVSGQLER